MDVTESSPDWLSLLVSVKHMTQQSLSYPGRSIDKRHYALRSVACKIDHIFQLVLALDLTHKDDQPRSSGYPGLFKCLECLKSIFQLDPEANNILKEFHNVVECAEVSDRESYLVCGVFEYLIRFLQEVDKFRNFVNHSFLTDAIYVTVLLSCMKALHENQPSELASLPLACLKYDSYASMVGNVSNCGRVFNVTNFLKSHNPHVCSPFVGQGLESSNDKELDIAKDPATCYQSRVSQDNLEPQQKSFLPDVVACHTKKHESCGQNQPEKYGQNWMPESSTGISNPVPDSKRNPVGVIDGVLEEESSIPPQLSEKILQLKCSVDYDYVGENAHLNLSELLIAAIQGQKCGLSRPDLLDSSIDSRVPDTMKSYPFAEGDSLHDIAFSIQDSLCNLESATVDSDDIYGNGGGSSTDEEINNSILGEFDDCGTSRDADWFISENDAPQALLPLPKNLAIEDLNNTCSPTRSRTSSVETFGKPQLRLMLRPNKDRSRTNNLAVQKYRCSGCGVHAEKSSARKYRFCEFMGEYFCPDCHDNKSFRVIPAHILHDFNFKRYKVSKIASIILDEIHEEPVFNLQDINCSLFVKNKSLSRCYEFRKCASDLLKKLEACPIVWDDPAHSLRSILLLFPPHILKGDPAVFSVHDLMEVRNGQLEKLLITFKVTCEAHFQTCELCGN